jgi:gas vesicle protein
MAQLSAKPGRRAASNPRRMGKVARGGAKPAARNPRAARRGAGLLGRSVRGGGKLWAKGKRTKLKARAGGKGAKTGAKVLKAARRRRPSRARLIATGVIGAAGAYFLDPKSGKRRRDVATDKLGKWLRRGRREAERKASYAGGVAAGAAAEASSSTDRRPAEERLNEPALARKVESEVLRDADPDTRGAVSVNVENGVVHLRGELPDEARISALAAKARQVEGVRGVENLLHTPGGAAPAKSEGGAGSEAV